MKVPVISNLRKPTYLLTFLGSAFLIFDASYYIMTKLPGSRDFMCVEGANFTPLNIAFSVVLSLLTGLMIAGLIALFKSESAKRKGALTSVSGVGFGLGSFTIFCPLCTLPILSMFGLSVFFELFVEYDLIFKAFSFVLMSTSLYILNKQLNNECSTCAYEPVEASDE